MGAADYAENPSSTPPPKELEYAWQCAEYPGALPNAGGLRDQPAGLIRRMRVTYNVWNSVREYFQNDQSTKWTKANPDKWKIVAEIMEYKIRRDRGEF